MSNSLLWSQPKELASAEWRIGNLHNSGKEDNLGRLPFHQKFRCEFPEISMGEWYGFFRLTAPEWKIGDLHKFRKRGQPREVYANFRNNFPGNFRSIWLSPRNFRDFRLNGSRLENSTIFVFSGTFPREFRCNLSPFRKCRNFWSNGKRPCLRRYRKISSFTPFAVL